jgi:hypothetical protein
VQSTVTVEVAGLERFPAASRATTERVCVVSWASGTTTEKCPLASTAPEAEEAPPETAIVAPGSAVPVSVIEGAQTGVFTGSRTGVPGPVWSRVEKWTTAGAPRVLPARSATEAAMVMLYDVESARLAEGTSVTTEPFAVAATGMAGSLPVFRTNADAVAVTASIASEKVTRISGVREMPDWPSAGCDETRAGDVVSRKTSTLAVPSAPVVFFARAVILLVPSMRGTDAVKVVPENVAATPFTVTLWIFVAESSVPVTVWGVVRKRSPALGDVIATVGALESRITLTEAVPW